MDYDSMAQRKSMLGSGGVVIMDEDTCMVKACLRLMKFYAHESCGWCILAAKARPGSPKS